jgi:acyl carrier protein
MLYLRSFCNPFKSPFSHHNWVFIYLEISVGGEMELSMVLEKIKALVAQQFDVEEESISTDTTIEELGGDTIDITELLTALEEEFDIEISEEWADKIETVGDVVTSVKKSMPKN